MVIKPHIMHTHCNCTLLSCTIIGLCISDSNPHVIYSSDRGCHTQLVDVLMKTYTSEAVFLLTTFVNMARSRSAENDEERLFINTVTREIFEVQWNPSNPVILQMMSCSEMYHVYNTSGMFRSPGLDAKIYSVSSVKFLKCSILLHCSIHPVSHSSKSFVMKILPLFFSSLHRWMSTLGNHTRKWGRTSSEP